MGPVEKSGDRAPVEGQVVEIPIIYYGFQHHPRWLAGFQPSTVFFVAHNPILRGTTTITIGI